MAGSGARSRHRLPLASGSLKPLATWRLRNFSCAWSLGPWNYPIYAPIERDNVQLPASILSKRADGGTRRQELRPVELCGDVATAVAEAQHEAVAVIGIEIDVGHHRQPRAAIDVAARDRAGAEGVRILDYGIDQSGCRA